MLKKRTKRILAIVALVVVVMFILGMMLEPLLSARADGLSDLQNASSSYAQQKQQAQQDMKSASSAAAANRQSMQELEQQIETLTQQISANTEQVNALNAQIDQEKQDIAKTQQDISDNTALYKQRLRAAYETGDVSYVEVLLSSKDFTDFMLRVETLKVVSKYTSGILQKLEADKQSVQAAEASVEQKRNALAAKQKQLDASEADLNSRFAAKKTLDAQLAKDQQTYQKQYDEASSGEAKAQQQIADFMKSHSSGGATSVGAKDVTLLWPIQSVGTTNISSTYGPRAYDTSHPHAGVDIISSAGIDGKAIVAAYDGVAYPLTDTDGYGNYVMIYHPAIGYWTLYGHCQTVYVSSGQTVHQGDVIALAGSTGDASGPHLHFEIRGARYGSTINPLEFTYSKCNCTNITYYRSHGNDGLGYIVSF